MRFAVCAALVTYVVMALSWHDQVHLIDGTRGRLLSVSEPGHTTTLRIDQQEVTVPDSEVASIEPGLASLVQRVSLPEALLAVVLTLPIPFLCAYRFYLLLVGLDLAVAKARTIRVSLASYVFHLAMPGATGGDVYRAIMLKKATGAWRPVLVGVLADRVLGLLGLIAWAALASAIWLDHPLFAAIAQGILAACIMGSVGLYVVLRFRLYRPLFGWLKVFRKNTSSASEGMFAIGERLLERRRVLTKAFALSLIAQGFNLASVAAVGFALGIDYAFEAAGLIMPAAMVLAIVTPTPQGLGVLEGVLVLILAPLIAGGANACVLLALGVRFLRLVWAAPGAALLLRGKA